MIPLYAEMAWDTDPWISVVVQTWLELGSHPPERGEGGAATFLGVPTPSNTANRGNPVVDQPRLLLVHEVAATVLLPTLLVGLGAERLLFAVADGLDAVGSNAGLH